MSQHDDGFDDVINAGYQSGQYQQPSTIDPNPYGIPPNSIPVKPGLTPRGKVALAFGVAALATGGLVGYQVYSADQAASEAKAQEVAYKKDQLELEKLKVLNETSKSQNSAGQVRQKQIDACVKDSRDLVGKSVDSSVRDIVEACQSQYQTAANGSDMQNAAAAHDSGGGINDGVFIVGGILVAGLVVMVKKGARSNAA